MATTVVSFPHFILFPFMSQSHTISLLHLARLLHRRNISITIFTTPANSPSIRIFLKNTNISIIELPFPENIPGVPSGIESTDKLPSMSFFIPFANATKLIQPHFEQAIETLPPVHCIISDGFLGWTQQTADKLGIPRLVLYGLSNYAMTLCEIVAREKPHAGVSSDDEPFSVPSFPWIKLTRNDFEPPFSQVEPKGAISEFIIEQCIETFKSHGIVVNSFYELEPRFNDYWNQKIGPRAWCVGPLCLAEPPEIQTSQRPTYLQWIDRKLTEESSILYVAFGSQAVISAELLQEIAVGLERSEVSFLWVLRAKGLQFLQGLEERVKDRGIIVREWVDQMEILGHKAIDGFLSHCGWNSVMEGVCKGVPILALPLMAEQHVNARMMAEEIGIGLRIPLSNGSVRGFVRSEEVERMVRELMKGEKGKEVRKKVKKMKDAACGAMKEGGSSCTALDQLIDEVCGEKVD